MRDLLNLKHVLIVVPSFGLVNLICMPYCFIDIVTSEEDLNKVSEEYLREKKEEMEQAFKAHQLLPDNPDYVYDKEEDFREGEVECGWDTDQESDQKF